MVPRGAIKYLKSPITHGKKWFSTFYSPSNSLSGDIGK